MNIMPEIKYKVVDVCGDYATCVSEKGSETNIAIYLLPEGIDVGDMLLFKNLMYEKVWKILAFWWNKEVLT